MSSSLSNTVTGPGRKLGRAAGVGYLVMAVTGGFWFGAMQAIRAGGDAGFLTRIRDSQLVFELSIAAGAAQFAAYLVTAALLFRRFGPKAPVAAGLLFAFVVASLPLSLAALGRQLELLWLANQDPPAHADSILHGFDTLLQLSSLFWGLWLLPLALFAFRAGGWSRLVGVLLILGGLGYLTAFARPLLLSDSAVLPLAQMALAVLGVATLLSELAAILWLLIAADRPHEESRAASAA